ncbi:hypothetical protein ACWCXH_33660 [Kitasatospora sp. NPDC001660]
MDGERYIPGLLARLQDAGGGWLTPPSGRLVLGELLPLLNSAAAGTTGRASRLWTYAATAASAQLWVAGDDPDRELWDHVANAVARAAAEQPRSSTLS